ncbi:MAG TPA: GNAT family N-acetyltransferase [Steroidobacteraceae bacterium]|nr:GNAT family N-acetyltransferase [Steroidobacteraceae bacterium]
MHALPTVQSGAARRARDGSGITRLEAPLEAHAALPGWWGRLFQGAAGASIFLSPDWMQTWLEVYGRQFRGSWLRWEAGGETVGGCLLLWKRIWRRGLPLATLYLNCAEDTGKSAAPVEFNGILHRPGYEDAIAHDLARAMAGRRWTRLALSGYEDSPLMRTLLERAPLCGVDREERPSPYVDFAALAGADYAATLSAKTRSQIRRCRRLYEETHGPVLIEAAADCEQALAFIAELAVLHNATWRSRGTSGAFASGTFREFHRRLIRRLWATRGVDVLRARAGAKVIGYVYSFLLRGKVYCYQSGFVQERDNNLKPGMLTHACAIDHYRERGHREYDFLAGDVRYKRSLAKSQRLLVWSVGYRRGAYAWSLLRARALRRKLLARQVAPVGEPPAAAGAAAHGVTLESP